MKQKLLATMALAGLIAAGAPARADSFNFNISGPGIFGHIELTYGPGTDATYPQAQVVTGISGTFTDTNNGLNLVNAPITGLVALNPAAPDVSNLLAPANFSKFFIASGSAFGDFSYDQLFWPTGSVPTATDYQVHGGFLDIYGLLFTVDGDTVNLWSNGDSGSGVDYGVGVATAAQQLDYVSGGVEVPEPGSLALFGVGLLGLAWRRRATA